MSDTPDWLLVLRPLPDAVPPGRRIARVLKVLRRHRLRCVEVRPVEREEAAAKKESAKR